ncbi:hypothetical protein [Streptomyces melanosporofaciens]|nr:hypothetical protein [Streptomyces melanosporofaciens]WTB12060.1 hypothetical protein OG546_49745 [Streptomyces antimycoticus]
MEGPALGQPTLGLGVVAGFPGEAGEEEPNWRFLDWRRSSPRERR